MLDFLTDLMETSIGCGVVILLFILLTPVLSKRFSPRWRITAWLLIAARMLCMDIYLDEIFPAPVQLETPQALVESDFRGTEGYLEDYATVYQHEYPLSYLEIRKDDYRVEGTHPDGTQWEIEDDYWERTVIKDGAEERTVHYPTYLCYAWGIVAFGGFILVLVRYGMFRRKTLKWSVPASEDDLAALDKLKEQLNVKDSIELYRCSIIRSPLLMGFQNPVILLPDGLPKSALETALAHELTHFKNSDPGFLLYLSFVRSIHWFNPLAWAMVRQARRDVEEHCDYCLLEHQGIEKRQAYGQAILDQMTADQGISPLTTGFSGDKKSIFTRFRAIMDTSPKKKGAFALVLATCIILMAGGLVACNSGAADAPNPIGSPVMVTLESDPNQSIDANYYEQGFDWEYDDLPTLTSYSNNETVTIHLPDGVAASDVRISEDHYHADDPYEINKIDRIEKDSQIYTLPKNHNVFEIPVSRVHPGAEEHMFIFLTWGDDSQFRYVFRVDFAAPVPAVTAYLDDREDEAITASYYPDGFHGDFKDLPTLYADEDNMRLTIQFPSDFTDPVYLGHTQYSGIGILEEVPEIDFQELSLRSLEDNNTRYGPNAEFSLSLLGSQTGFEHKVFFLTWGEESQFHYVFQVKAKPNPELTLTDAFDFYPSAPFSVSATEQDGIPYYKFENAPVGISILMPEHCQTDPSIISYRGKTITAILPCNPLAGYLYGNVGGIASFAAVDLTDDGKEELLYLWGYGGTGVWEDQCKIFDLSTMDELPVLPVDEELLAKCVQAELLGYEDSDSALFRITTEDDTVAHSFLTAQNTEQLPGPVDLGFDGHTHLKLEENQLKLTVAFSPKSDGTFMYTMSYLGDLTGTLTYSPSLRAFTLSPPFTMELYDPIEYQP